MIFDQLCAELDNGSEIRAGVDAAEQRRLVEEQAQEDLRSALQTVDAGIRQAFLDLLDLLDGV